MASTPDSADDSQPQRPDRPAATPGEAAATGPAKGPVLLRERPERPEPAVEEDARMAAYLRGPTAFCA